MNRQQGPGMRAWMLAAGLAALLAMAGCSSGPKKPEPTPLSAVTPTLGVRQAWTANVGAVDPLTVPVVQGERLAVANANGAVSILDAGTGAVVWRADAGAPLSAGVGYDGQRAAVVTRSNDLVALTAKGEQWRVRLGARVFTPPLVAGERVFVLTGDRSVSAYDGSSGARLWTQTTRGTEALVLQQPGVLVAVGDTLLAGISGRLVAFDPNTGAIRWDAAIARPRGVNEIERLVDLVARVGRVGDEVCVRAFQAAVGCVDARRGTVLWTQPANGATGVHADADQLYAVESDGRVMALRRTGGERVWTNERLRFRGLTAPLVLGRSVAVGDSQGHVHLLSRQDGTFLNRMSTDGSAIVHGPLLAGTHLLVVTRSGGVFAWRPE